jgi:hypothetical protein
MKNKTTTRITLLLGLALAFAGCNSTTQTTSGRDYVSKYESAPMGDGKNIDQQIREIASVEPILRFPARIGLAKIHNGQISNLSEEEAAAWNETSTTLGTTFGEFIPISPLIAEMVYTPTGEGNSRASEVVRKIRLGAARQHIDAVLIYEVFSETEEKTLPTAVAVWTIIGAYFVPSEESNTIAYANALLVDVRNGYPYGTATATAEERDLSTFAGHRDNMARQKNEAHIAAALNLAPETVEMFRTLQAELK